jgi:hypothetical protein
MKVTVQFTAPEGGDYQGPTNNTQLHKSILEQLTHKLAEQIMKNTPITYLPDENGNVVYKAEVHFMNELQRRLIDSDIQYLKRRVQCGDLPIEYMGRIKRMDEEFNNWENLRVNYGQTESYGMTAWPYPAKVLEAPKKDE